MTRAIMLLSLLAVAACGLPQSPGAPSGGTYNPVSKTNNDG
jgi:hypothetical protein